VPLAVGKGAGDLPIQLYLSYNRFRVATPEALYSDGVQYPPVRKMLSHFNGLFSDLRSVLMLGVGSGSLVAMLGREGVRPHYTLVDVDENVLQWAIEVNAGANKGRLDPVCEDASTFVQRNNSRFDLVFVDVFIGRTVPGFIMHRDFLQHCRRAISPGGFFGLNYIVNDDDAWYEDQQTFMSVFPEATIIAFDMNRVLVARID
jgi:spermidine synthase